MQYGRFDDDAKEYLISTPKTPYPWINYLGTDGYFGLVSNTAGGYSFYKDANFRRLSRYRYNASPIDIGGRYYFIKDGDTIWNPGWSPAKTELDSYECAHGLGYTRISGAKNGLASVVDFFVPLGENLEIHRVKLENTSSQKKSIKFVSYIEFALWNASDDMQNFQRNFSTGEVEVETGKKGTLIVHRTEYRERRNHYAWYWSSREAQGFDTSRESFYGLYNPVERPQVLEEGRPGNSVANGWAPVGSHWHEISLEPGATEELVFILGYAELPNDQKFESYVEAGAPLPQGFYMSGSGSTRRAVANKAPLRGFQEKYAVKGAVDKALNELKEFWNGLLATYQAKTPDDKVNRMVNIWNQYQCMVTYNLARSASYFESGIGRGLGFRDTNQDMLGFVHQIPERAKERILDVAATQFPDGGCYHQFQPLTKRGNNAIGGNFNDDPLWLILAVAAYIKETGDWDILDIMVPYDHKEELAAPLYDHLIKSYEKVAKNLGPNGLPLIGRADWNDCLNLNTFSTDPNESFQTAGDGLGKVAESVFIAGLFCYAVPELVTIAKRRGDKETAAEAATSIKAIERAVMSAGWDGLWYRRAYDAQGKPVGSKENLEGKIFIEPQGFCAMARIGADKGYPRMALDSVKEHLATPYGIVLQQPAYSRYYVELGEISSYPPGYKENAGIFCHNNPWVIIAEALEGRADQAFDYYQRISPAHLEEISEVHRLEPYVYAQMIAGTDAPTPGEAKNSWLTGTAAWNFVAISQFILGVRPDYDGLLVDPKLPSDWDSLEVQRVFRGVRFDITVSRAKAGESAGISVEGKEIDGKVVPLPESAKVCKVKVVI